MTDELQPWDLEELVAYVESHPEVPMWRIEAMKPPATSPRVWGSWQLGRLLVARPGEVRVEPRGPMPRPSPSPPR